MTEEEKLYNVTIYYVAQNQEEAETLFDKMLVAIGCDEDIYDGDCECPHFRLASGPQEDTYPEEVSSV